MSDKINIPAILAKHITQKGDPEEENYAAIKEIVEAVIDKCAKGAKIDNISSWSEASYATSSKTRKKFETKTHNRNGSVSYEEYIINEQSILKIKEEIEYE